MKISILNRILLLATSLLAAYQIAVGIDGLSTVPVICYTIGFGVLLVSSLLILILGYEVLDSPIVVVVATIIPLTISLGLVWEYLPAWRVPYLVFVLGGFLAILVTRLFSTRRPATILLAVVHGIAGLVIFILPIYLSLTGRVNPGFILVGIGWGTPLSLAAAIVFIVNHSLVKSALLMLAGALASRTVVKSAAFSVVTGLRLFRP